MWTRTTRSWRHHGIARLQRVQHTVQPSAVSYPFAFPSCTCSSKGQFNASRSGFCVGKSASARWESSVLLPTKLYVMAEGNRDPLLFPSTLRSQLPRLNLACAALYLSWLRVWTARKPCQLLRAGRFNLGHERLWISRLPGSPIRYCSLDFPSFSFRNNGPCRTNWQPACLITDKCESEAKSIHNTQPHQSRVQDRNTGRRSMFYYDMFPDVGPCFFTCSRFSRHATTRGHHQCEMRPRDSDQPPDLARYRYNAFVSKSNQGSCLRIGQTHLFALSRTALPCLQLAIPRSNNKGARESTLKATLPWTILKGVTGFKLNLGLLVETLPAQILATGGEFSTYLPR